LDRAIDTASIAAIDDADTDGTNANQYPDQAKYTVHAAFPPLVNAAHDHDTPSTSPLDDARPSCGTNCGTANTAAARGARSNTYVITTTELSRHGTVLREHDADSAARGCELTPK
jgi:hypothetical protein